MRQKIFGNFCVILIMILAFVPNIATAEQLKVRNVDVNQVPGLLSYVKANFPGVRISQETIKVKLVDLDKDRDGIYEILLGIEDYSFSCGNRGCSYSALKRDSSGNFIQLGGFIAFDLVPAPGYSKGYRNLATSTTADSESIYKFDGDWYRS